MAVTLGLVVGTKGTQRPGDQVDDGHRETLRVLRAASSLGTAVSGVGSGGAGQRGRRCSCCWSERGGGPVDHRPLHLRPPERTEQLWQRAPVRSCYHGILGWGGPSSTSSS